MLRLKNEPGNLSTVYIAGKHQVLLAAADIICVLSYVYYHMCTVICVLVLSYVYCHMCM